MQIKLIRKSTNSLYTEGELLINGKRYADTVESTETMNAPGVYTINGQIRNFIGHGNSWIESRKNLKVLIGEHLIPGIVTGSRPLYDRLIDRAKKTKRPISLIITDNACQHVAPISHWKSETRNAKLSIIFVFALMLLTGCATTRSVVVRETTHDTLHINTIQFDSIYVDNWHLTDRSRDTVYIHDIHRENHYKFLKDTVRVVSVDSIPVIHEVQKPVKYVPAIYKWSLGICIVLMVIILVMITIRVIRVISVR